MSTAHIFLLYFTFHFVEGHHQHSRLRSSSSSSSHHHNHHSHSHHHTKSTDNQVAFHSADAPLARGEGSGYAHFYYHVFKLISIPLVVNYFCLTELPATSKNEPLGFPF